MSKAWVFRWGEDPSTETAISDPGEHTSIVLGRSPGCDVIVPRHIDNRNLVSRSHARLRRRGHDYFVEDMRSENFTLAAGRVVFGPTQISLPCELALGPVKVTLRLESLEKTELDAFAERSHEPYVNEEMISTLRQDFSSSEWDNVRGEIDVQMRWATALIGVIDAMAGSVSTRQVCQDLDLLLSPYLDAARVNLVFDVKPGEIEQRLEDGGYSPRAAATLRHNAERLSTEAPMQMSAVENDHLIAWVALAGSEGNERISLLIAEFEETRSTEELDDEQKLIGAIALRAADPFLSVLRQVEHLKNDMALMTRFPPDELTIKKAWEARFLGNHPLIRDCLYQAERAAEDYLVEENVLLGINRLPALYIWGEDGVGKRSMAHLIHEMSDRSARELVEVNCAALDESDLAAEIFGHEVRSPSGTIDVREGRLERAADGILYFSQAERLSNDLQIKLLKVLDFGVFQRVGGAESRQTNCYFILSSAQRSSDHLAEGRFLPAFEIRVGAFSIEVPPLRRHISDLDDLIAHFLSQPSTSPKKSILAISPQVKALFLAHSWNGNLSELRECLRVALALAPPEATELEPEHLPRDFYRKMGLDHLTGEARTPELDLRSNLNENVLRIVQREYLARLMGEENGVLEEVRKRAGIATNTLRTKLLELCTWLEGVGEDGGASALEKAQFKEWAGEKGFEVIMKSGGNKS